MSSRPAGPSGQSIIVFAGDVAAVLNWLDHEGVAATDAWFIGQDYRLRKSIEESWQGKLVFSSMAGLLDETSKSLEPVLIDIDRLLMPEPLDRGLWDAWLASDIGDRGPYASLMFEAMSKLKVFIECAENSGRHLFVFEDKRWARAFYEAGRARGCSVTWRSLSKGRPVTDNMSATLEGAVQWILSVMRRSWHVLRFVKRMKVFGAERRRHPLPDISGVDSLIVTWADNRTFQPDRPTEHLPNLGRLPSILRGGDLQLGYLAMPLDWVVDGNKVRSSAIRAHDLVFTIEDCIRLGDLIVVAIETFRLGWFLRRRAAGQISVGGINYAGVVRLAIAEETGKWRPVQSALYRFVARELVRRGAEISRLVYPFEGQPWEKSLLTGVRRLLPSCKTVGYQYGVFAPNHVSFFPSAREMASGIAPDRLLVTGNHFAALFERQGFPQRRISKGGALRHAAQLASAHISHANRDAGVHRTLLCCCSISPTDDLEMLDKTAMALESRRSLSLIVNFHPLTPAEGRSVVWELGSIQALSTSGRLMLSDKPLSALLSRADVLVYDRAGAIFEGIAIGLPAIYVVSDNRLRLNKIIGGSVPECVTPQDIGEVLDCLSADGGPSKSLVDDYLAPVDEAAILAAVVGAS